MSLPQNPFLGVTKRIGEIDYSVSRIEVDHADSGVRLIALSRGQVPVFEEHSARLERGISLDDWYALHYLERAMIVAVRRLDIGSKNQQSEADARKINRDSKRK